MVVPQVFCLRHNVQSVAKSQQTIGQTFLRPLFAVSRSFGRILTRKKAVSPFNRPAVVHAKPRNAVAQASLIRWPKGVIAPHIVHYRGCYAVTREESVIAKTVNREVRRTQKVVF